MRHSSRFIAALVVGLLTSGTAIGLVGCWLVISL
jgi:hypothetical protein